MNLRNWATTTVVLALTPALAKGDILTFAPGITSTPPTATGGGGAFFIAPHSLTFVADTPYLSSVLNIENFTTANGWNFTSSNNIQYAEDSNFYISTYNMAASSQNFSGGADILLKFSPGSMSIPQGGTFHWLQVVNPNRQLFPNELPPGSPPFGYTLQGSSGYWFIDNGFLASGPGITPYYDNWWPTLPKFTFNDHPSDNQVDLSTNWNIWVFPAWDVVNNGSHTMYVGNGGVYWGFYDPPSPNSAVATVPEPAFFIFAMLTSPVCLCIFTRHHR